MMEICCGICAKRYMADNELTATCPDCWNRRSIAQARGEAIPDLVNSPPHYTNHPSGVNCIQITEHMNFCLGNAIKYIWRSGSKGEAVEDLNKAIWYLQREVKRLETSKKAGM